LKVMPECPARYAFAAVLLAAGASSRMGRPKLLLPWGATSILGHHIHEWTQLGAAQTAVVLAAGNQPLNAVKLWTTGLLLLLERDPGTDTRTVIEQLRKIQMASDRIANVINHMRMLVRHGDKVVVEPACLNEAVRSSLSLVSAKLGVRRTFRPSLRIIFSGVRARCTSESVAVAVGQRAVCAVSDPKHRSVRSPLRFMKLCCFSVVSCARGVSQSWALTSNRPFGFPAEISFCDAPFAEDTLTVGQNEQSLTLVRRVDFLRRKQACLNAVTHASKVIVDLFEPQS